jgi:hypothetical protein
MLNQQRIYQGQTIFSLNEAFDPAKIPKNLKFKGVWFLLEASFEKGDKTRPV